MHYFLLVVANMRRAKVLILFSLILSKNTSCQEAQMCPTSTVNNSVTWPSTANVTLSQPPCVGKSKEFLYRKCLGGKWNTEPQCFYIQEETPPNCPEDFFYSEILKICYKFVNGTFPFECPFTEVLPFDSYKALIANNGPVWMPVARKVETSGNLFLYWNEASSKYGSYFEAEYEFHGRIKDKNCVLYHNSSYIEAVFCNETYFGVCAYELFDQISDPLCLSEYGDLCYRSDFAANSTCFCYSEERNYYPKAEFVKPYQNRIYTKLTNNTCSIGLEKRNGTYIWTHSGEEIAYSYWSRETVFDSTHIYGAASPEGWILTEEQIECGIYEIEKDMPVHYLNLVFDNTSNEFLVTIGDRLGQRLVSSEIFLFCFTNADSLELVTRVSDLVLSTNGFSEKVYKFKPLETGDGDYWCQFFRYGTLQETREVSLKSKSVFEFVAIVEVEYSAEIDPLSKDITVFLNNTLFLEMNATSYFEEFYIPRIMQILDLDEDNRLIRINLHLTRILQSDKGHVEEFFYVQMLFEEFINRIKKPQMTLISFSNLLFCKEETGKLTWPNTPANTLAYSEEYCMKSDGERLTRYCKGGDTGARWEETDENCTIYESSSHTNDFTNVTKNSVEALKVFASIQDKDYKPIDLYLISKSFSNLYSYVLYGYLNETMIELFLDVVNGLFEIDREVLIEAQSQLDATDNLLYTASKIVTQYQRPFEANKKYFYVKTSSTSEFNGVKIANDENFTITEITGDCNITEIQNANNLIGAVCLSPELRKQVPKSKLTVIIYFEDYLFNNEIKTVKPIDLVFEVALSDAHPYEKLNGSIWVFEKPKNVTSSCFYWDLVWDNFFKPVRGSWKQIADSTDLENLEFCEFERTGHFTFTESLNVTESLINVLNSNSSASKIMTRLSEISRKHDEFVPVDVFLVGQILEKVNNLGETRRRDLQLLSETVSNLQEIRKATLSQSQLEAKATDNILDQIDKLIRSYDYESPVEIVNDSFKILVSDTKTNNFSGLILTEQNQKISIEILTEDRSIEDVATTENLRSAILLSPQLKNQLEDDGKVIVTVSLKDALFNERKPGFTTITTIFGVILSQIEEYKGPISILYKVDQDNGQKDCVHWFYNQTRDGFWLKDQSSRNVSSLSYCEFWHTTHFALLLFDKDIYEEEVGLDWITTINCALSLFGLSSIAFTGLIFKKWRQNSGNMILLNVVFAMILQICTFYISGNLSRDDYTVCTATGILLHYSTISEFCWMLVIAFLQYKRFVQVLGEPPQHVLLKSCLLGWIVPFCPVAALFLLDQENYVDRQVGLCYPSGFGLYLGVWLPVLLIVIINFIFYVCIIFSVISGRRKNHCGRGSNYNETILEWRLGILLFFTLGLTWMFGLLTDLDKLFAYLFCITATLQGFVLFLFFIVFHEKTKYLYAQCFRKCFHKI